MSLAFGLLCLSGQARAADVTDQCQVAGDCGAGYVCTVQQGGACPDVACLPGQVCPEPQCELTEYHSCRPAPCRAASDCPADMLCHTQVTATCGGDDSAAPCPDGECEAPSARPSPECTEQSTSLCTPRYLLPCKVAADCGAGFNCVEEVSGWCSGAAPVPSADGGTAIVAPEPECGSTRTGTYRCELVEQTCQKDSDCVSGFVCAQDPSGSTCSSGGSSGSSGSPAAPDIFPAADGGADPCTASVAAKLCLPRDHTYAVANDGLTGGSTSKGEAQMPSATHDESAKGGGDGCSLRAGTHPRGGWLLMFTSIMAAVIYRRRSATRA